MAGSVLSHAVWVVGPLSGLIVAPLVGALSDRCTTRYGRRKPFIFGGMVATVSSMLGFSNSTRIASLFAVSGTEAHRISAIVIAVISFCVLDLAINTTMWPGAFSEKICSFDSFFSFFFSFSFLSDH